MHSQLVAHTNTDDKLDLKSGSELGNSWLSQHIFCLKQPSFLQHLPSGPLPWHCHSDLRKEAVATSCCLTPCTVPVTLRVGFLILSTIAGKFFVARDHLVHLEFSSVPLPWASWVVAVKNAWLQHHPGWEPPPQALSLCTSHSTRLLRLLLRFACPVRPSPLKCRPC